MEDLYRVLRAGHVQAQGIVDTIPDPLLVLDGGLCVLNASRSFCQTFEVERDHVIGKSLFELGNGQWDIPKLRQLLGEVIPHASAVIDFKVEHDFPLIGRRVMLLTARRLHHPDGPSHSLLLSIVDATERQQHDSEQSMLLAELKHRMKNLFAVARSIARLTAIDGRSAEQYRDDFMGRFDALISAQDIAFDTDEAGGLQLLCQRILAPYAARSEAVLISPGPTVDLSHSETQSLALMLHELATNAAKYGALSVHGGQVAITWSADTAGLHLIWKERGGPPVKTPEAPGFGTRLIHSVAAYNAGGEVKLNYVADGLEAKIGIPLGRPSTKG